MQLFSCQEKKALKRAGQMPCVLEASKFWVECGRFGMSVGFYSYVRLSLGRFPFSSCLSDYTGNGRNFPIGTRKKKKKTVAQ